MRLLDSLSLTLLSIVACLGAGPAPGEEFQSRKPPAETDAPDASTPANAADRKGSALDRALREAGEDESPRSALDDALREAAVETPSDVWSLETGPVNLRFIDLAADLLVAAGGSTAMDEELQLLQGGGHDPRKRGFTLQALEVSLMGAVDPYFTAEVHLLYFLDPLDGESEFELEEAFLATLDLPFGLDERGLELEVGHFFTEFGRLNPRHPHSWKWLDQSVINTRLFGPDGVRAPGLRLGWLTPLPWFCELHVGAQNANGETMASFLANDEFFEERAVGGRPFVDRDVRNLEDFTYLARLDNSWDLTETVTAKLGGSLLAGPNATGSDGDTLIYGADFLLKWRPLENDRGWPFVLWQSEIMKRDYRADSFLDDQGTPDPSDDLDLAGDTLEDWGLYTQGLYGFVRDWAAGIRYEYATGSGPSVGRFSSREEDPFRDDRHRVSPLLVWHPTHFSRVRLQYNYDRAEHLQDGDAHSVWIGFEVLFGQHPAHTY